MKKGVTNLEEKKAKVQKAPPAKKEAKKQAVKLHGKLPSVPHDEKPIKMNPVGKYNLKFIDWTNEWEAIGEYMHNPDAQENPCGLDEREFEAIVRQDLGMYYKAKNGIQESSWEKIKHFKAKATSNPSTVCSICIERFHKDQLLMELPCKHLFHDKCIKDWLESHHICPMCRQDLNG